MSVPPPELGPVIERYRAGDLPGARVAAEAGLAANPGLLPLRSLAGMIACQMGDPAGGAAHLRIALAAAPEDKATRLNLASALAATGALDEAAQLVADGDDPRFGRLGAWIAQEQGRLGDAVAGYEAVLAADSQDFESWNNLGNARAALGDSEGAIAALERAINLRRDLPALYINLSKLLADLDQPEPRRTTMREAARVAPNDAEVLYELGLAEAGAHDRAAAEAAFRGAIARTRGFTPAYVELGLLLENLNRIEALESLVEEAARRGVEAAEIDYLRAWVLRRRGAFAEAMVLAEAAPDTINPIRRNQLIAELADRLGDADKAFPAFVAMNQASIAAAPPTAENYLAEVEGEIARLTPEKVAAWSTVEIVPEPPAPVFIAGFPRSGTTLLDTLLMNIPDLHVLEELPVMRQVEGGLDPNVLAGLTSAQVQALRSRYFEALGLIAPPPRAGMTVVDKYPLHMARVPLIHRTFPDAKLILVERHPCDAVLSCFMSNFQLNKAMREFVTLEGAARLYDRAFTCWERAEALLPVNVHRIRYERMVEDLEGEMRALLGFLGIAWDEKVLDNRGAAAKRDHIRTASYAQVTEPIYTRSAGRWERYRAQMAPVLPVLAPWAEKMGYRV
ncbi:sulfotransferase [Sphingomonas sp. LB-2]|uniref:tetratricopeptide repeat-containing sulfotransferase family protein n=1 Tax=Sphingomonas caeni TaxID=2984949 RepID=UPI00222EA8F0|nr:tetratricopeptide repeat-containing sulfotransferase family protein [Sphingomonas caeni]MCW3846269.1 sulfotransferase [Sphingomonas caeni]